MNIEELELSLRTEFEGQIRSVLAGVKQDVAEFQKKFEVELQKHQSQLESTFNELIARLPESAGCDDSFTESVGEHLRLARDDGAQVAAIAFGEAEKLKAETDGPQSYEIMRDAVAEISSKTTQATILQALVENAAKFTSRGAFFIVKNDHLVGWKVFGKNVFTDDGAVREVLFPVTADTLLSSAVRTMGPVHGGSGSFVEDELFLSPLRFGNPDTMAAIPLTARGRGVAVLYADSVDGARPDIEALETLVRIAGLTVELLAASHSAPMQPAAVQAATPAPEQVHVEEAREYVENDSYASDHAEAESSYTEVETAEVSSSDDAQSETEYDATVSHGHSVNYESHEAEQEVAHPQAVEEAYSAFEQEAAEEVYEVAEESVAEEVASEYEVETAGSEFVYTGEVSYEEAAVEIDSSELSEAVPELESFAAQTVEAETEVEETTPVEPVVEVEETVESSSIEVPQVEYAFESTQATVTEIPVIDAPTALNGNSVVTEVAEPVVEQAAAPAAPRTRLSERNVDLPIEVAEDERRLHNDARRFARLLVSEIKLYNEDKVADGRSSSDLYDRLREAIDRSREMYDKRVQPAVASKFDYFHYELVNSLAEGVDSKLGSNYPGSSV